MGMDVHGKNGDTFRATIWSWPAILEFMRHAGFNAPNSWHYNSGEGLRTHCECTALAECLEAHFSTWHGSHIDVPSDKLFVNENGQLVTENSPGATTPFWTDRVHIAEWIEFLKTCEGFEIW